MSRYILLIRLAFTACLASFLFTATAAGDVARFDILDVGQGDAILVTSPEGKTLLVDAGPSGQVVNLLSERNVSAIDLAVLSHHHFDHYGGMDDVIRRFKVRNLLMTNSPHSTLRFRSLLRLIRDQDIRVLNPTEELRTLTLGTLTVRVFPKRLPYSRNENNNCIGLRVEHGNVSLLLTGDSERSQRRWWMKNVAPSLYQDCTILKLAHHGSSNGLDREWLEAVNPKLAVLSVGKTNGYGHPNSGPLSLLHAADVPLLRTDRVGTISIESDGTSWWQVNPGTSERGPPQLANVPNHTVAGDEASTIVPRSPTAAPTIFVTRTGRKYHRDGCRYLRSSKIAISEELAAENYTPCRVCRPPKLVPQRTTNVR